MGLKLTPPRMVKPGENLTSVAEVFSTRLVVKGKTWLPLTQLAALMVMTKMAKKRRRERTWLQSLGIGAMTMSVLLGSEWAHNIAHAAAAHRVGRPADAIRVIWGMPLLVYYDINDPNVTPRQHIVRALGGPVFSILMLLLSLLIRPFTKPDSAARDVAETAVGMNAFISGVGMLPIPGIDGGPVLKWSLVERGRSIEEADRVVRKVNGLLGPALAASVVAALKRRWWIGGLLAPLAAASISIALGIFKEQD